VKGLHVTASWVLTVIAVVAAGCGGDESAPSPDGRAAVIGEGAEMFPSSTLEDWKSYADHVAVYTVVAQREVPFQPRSYEAPDEGMIGRFVTVQVDRELWSADKAPALPSRFTISAPGWVLHEGERRVFRIRNSPRLEVGEKFLAPLVHREDYPSSAPPWIPLGFGSQLRVVEGKIASEVEEANPALASKWRGATVDEVASAVVKQEPETLAYKHRDLRPIKRVEAVIREGGFKNRD
jgi:hypothetical protein